MTVASWAAVPAAANAVTPPATYYAAPVGAGSADCSSPGNACLLPTAVGKTGDGDTVLLEDGTYHNVTDLVVTTSITLEPDGAATPVLDGDVGGDETGDPNDLLLVGHPAGDVSPSVTISGLTMQNYTGEAVDCEPEASVAIDSSTFASRAYAVGVATETDASSCHSLQVTDSTFTETDNGEGILNGANSSATVTVSGSTFDTTGTSDDATGFGILNAYTGTVTVTNSTFDTEAVSAAATVAGIEDGVNDGEVDVNGGSTFDTTVDQGAEGSFAAGILGLENGLISVADSTFHSGVTPGAVGSESDAVGIQTCDLGCEATKGPAMIVEGSEFFATTSAAVIAPRRSGPVRDHAEVVGPVGGFASGAVPGDATAEIFNSTFHADAEAPGSTATGVDDLSGDLTIAGSTLEQAVGGDATGATAVGAVDEEDTGLLTVTNSTVYGDGPTDAAVTGIVVTGGGSGVIQLSTITNNGTGLNVDDGDVTLEADIIGGNGTDCAHDGGPVNDDSDNIDSDGTCDFGGTSVSDSATIAGSLGPLADNGGPTETVGLQPGSPALGLVAGDLTLASDETIACANTDQRGVARAGVDDPGHSCDAGAFEGTLSSGGGGGGGGGGGSTTQGRSTITVTSSDESSTFGEPLTFTGTISPAPTCGSVTWLIDNIAQGSPILVTEGKAGPPGSNSLVFTLGPLSNLDVGAHPVTLAFPGCGTFGEGSGEVVQVVGKGDTTTSVSVAGSTYTATVKPDPPAAGTPTGSVTFFMDGAELGTSPLGADGTASFHSGASPAGAARSPASRAAVAAAGVSATYAGDGHFNGSSSQSAGSGGAPPTIKAKVTSKHHETRAGWYRSPVTITFRCTAGSAPLAPPGCPEPITLRHSGAAQSVTGTVRATDGGAASVTVSPINIDRTPPTHVRLHGAVVGQAYAFAHRHRHLSCTARDRLSGVRACTITRTRVRHRHFVVVHVTMTASNHAGGVSVTRGSYRYRRNA